MFQWITMGFRGVVVGSLVGLLALVGGWLPTVIGTAQPIATAQEGASPTGPKPPPVKPPPAKPTIDPDAGIPIWDLGMVEEEFRGGVAAIQDLRYKEARSFFKKALREAKKAGDPTTIKKLTFLGRVARDLEGGEKLARKSGRAVLQKAVALTTKNRETFAYFHFLEIERRIRDRFSLEIADFEPTLESYHLNELELFEPFRPRHTPEPKGYQITNTPEYVAQGKWALRWEDTPEVRNLGVALPSPSPNWKPYRYLCFSAKLADPKSASLQCVIAADELQQNRWVFGVGTWKGWKTFRIDFRKDATIKKSNAKLDMSWSQVSHLLFYAKGGLSNFYLDDVYLCR